MDKSWMQQSRVSQEYIDGAKRFIEFAFDHGATMNEKLKCPCTKCNNVLYQDRELAFEHMICNGIDRSYTTWLFHGEHMLPSNSNDGNIDGDESKVNENRGDEIEDMLHDAFAFSNLEGDMGGSSNAVSESSTADVDKFFKLVSDAEQEFYPGCKTHTKLSFIVKLYHLKCLGGCSNKSFTLLLDLLREALPDGSALPASFSQAKKMIADLGLQYDKIDACPNDCMLFWKESHGKDKCDVCGASRWKTEVNNFSGKKKKVPAKILRHFPLKQRLQRLFMSSKTASEMIWHDKGRTKDGALRHPADSPAWKHFDDSNPSFSLDPRHVRLGLASDGFNPYRTMSIAHSTWPVVLIPYNLPPWMCMKQPNMILSLLIPGPLGPGNDIDVYMRPLIEELKELWEPGISTYDATKNETFTLRAALLWTISDFPGYAMLSGWSTKGILACPACHYDTCSKHLRYGKKQCYMGHRRYLPRDHRFRRHKRSFDGTIEDRSAPVPLTGSDILNQLSNVKFEFGKMSSLNNPKIGNWKKLSIFFQLPYWEHNLLRHNLDVMHIEKNICDNVIGTLLNIDGKSKDNLKARLDLVEMGLRHALHPQRLSRSDKAYLPMACYTMNKTEKELFCRVLKGVKVPDGYSSNIARRVNIRDRKITGLKSHDSHVIMQQFLPLAVRKSLSKKVSSVMVELSNFFRELCSKVCRDDQLRQLEGRIALILCHLEMIFPPTFFDIMVHLPIHLVTEAKLGGPVHYRWMYPIERYLYRLKSYVRNRAHLEGSIAEGYLAEECLTFCSRYLSNVETRFNRPVRNCDRSAIGAAKPFRLNHLEWEQTHRYVLFNNERVTTYIEQHKRVLRMQYPRLRAHDLHKMHTEKFVGWFKTHVNHTTMVQLLQQSNSLVPEEIKLLSRGPYTMANRFQGYVQYGCRFRTVDREKGKKSQNSGVAVTATTTSYASTRDIRPIAGDLSYYGRLTDIIELTYDEGLKFVLFKCDWVDVRAQGRGIKVDEFGFTLVNFTRLLFQGQQMNDEPYVLASQAEQVFYVQDPLEPEWYIVIKNKPRDTYHMSEGNSEEDNAFWENQPFSAQNLDDLHSDDDNGINWVREDMPGTTVDATPDLISNIPSPSTHTLDEDEEDI